MVAVKRRKRRAGLAHREDFKQTIDVAFVGDALSCFGDAIDSEAEHERKHLGRVITVLISVGGQFVGRETGEEELEERGFRREESRRDARGEGEQVLNQACTSSRNQLPLPLPSLPRWRKRQLTERMEDSTSFSLVFLVEPVQPAHDQLDHSEPHQPFHQSLERLPPLLRRVLVRLSVVLVRLVVQCLRVKPFLEHFDHGNHDVRIFVREQVGERFGSREFEQDGERESGRGGKEEQGVKGLKEGEFRVDEPGDARKVELASPGTLSAC